MPKITIEAVRHSLSHLMTLAVLEIYPDAKLGVGPAIDHGFYQDYELPEPINDALLPKLQSRMKKLIAQKIDFIQSEVSITEALEFYKNDPYKTELIHELKDQGEKTLSFYDSGALHNLCAGPHVKNTSEINMDAFKLTKIAGAYWKGNEKNKMLTRIYGVAFATKKELDAYLALQAEAEKRDHRKLGKELGLFVLSDLVGPGLPLYTHKGTILRQQIVNYSQELNQTIGFEEVYTPNMNKGELFKVSGHYDKYKKDMFKVVSNYSEEEYFLKPMNCPQHTQIFAAQPRSYRDLPIRIADFANLYRDERPGELSGLTRLRCFCQDDGHCFCREDQIKSEFVAVLSAIKQAMDTYGMNYSIRLSLWDPEHKEKYLGEPKIWEKSQKLLEEILVENKIEYYRGVGEAAIYGPKMDLISKDSLGREWQISTIQLDFIMPQRFKLTYTDPAGKEITPVMIHRAIVGSPERFMGILIEHYAGAFPLWLAPVQVMILSVGEDHIAFCQKLAQEFSANNIRASLDINNESVGKKIRTAVQQKIPYLLVIGDKEMNSKDLMVRFRGEQEARKISKSAFLKRLQDKILTKAKDL